MSLKPSSRSLLVALVLLVVLPFTRGQCSGSSGILVTPANWMTYAGCATLAYPTVTIRTQAGQDRINFTLSNLVSIQGNVILTQFKGSQNVTVLSSLQTISGSLAINTNIELLNLNGFENLKTVAGSISIANNVKLVDFRMPALQSAGDFTLSFASTSTQITGGFPALVNVTGAFSLNQNGPVSFNGWFPLLKRAGAFYVYDLNSLTSFNGFESLTGINGLLLGPLPSLTNIAGLSSLTGSVDMLQVAGPLGTLPSLSFLSGITRVNNIFSLHGFPTAIDLAGLGSIQYVPTIHIYDMPWLTSLSFLAALTSTDAITIERCGITSLNGLAGKLPATLKSITLNNLPSLTSISALEALTTITQGPFRLTNLPLLASLNGLQKLTTFQRIGNIYDFEISDLPLLTNLDGLSAVRSISVDTNTRIYNNAKLANIRGLCNLRYVEGQTFSILLTATPMCCSAAQAVRSVWNVTGWNVVSDELNCTGGNQCDMYNNFTCSWVPPPDSSSSSSGGGSSSGSPANSGNPDDNLTAIIAGVVGGILGLIFLGVGTFLIYRRYRSKKNSDLTTKMVSAQAAGS